MKWMMTIAGIWGGEGLSDPLLQGCSGFSRQDTCSECFSLHPPKSRGQEVGYWEGMRGGRSDQEEPERDRREACAGCARELAATPLCWGPPESASELSPQKDKEVGYLPADPVSSWLGVTLGLSSFPHPRESPQAVGQSGLSPCSGSRSATPELPSALGGGPRRGPRQQQRWPQG